MTGLNELVIHGWDIQSKIEPSAHLSPEVLPVLMERIRQRYQRPRSCDFLRGYKLTPGQRYRFELIGEVTGQEDIIMEEDKCYLESAAGGTADVVFQCSSESFILLMNRRLALDEIAMSV